MAKKDVQIEVTNLAEVKASIRQFDKDVGKAMLEAVWKMALAVETVAKGRLAGTLGSAKHYITGRLASSVHWEMNKKSNDEFKPLNDEDRNLGVSSEDDEAIVGTNVSYASKIEYDYDSFLRFAAEKNEPKFIKESEDAINKLQKTREYKD